MCNIYVDCILTLGLFILPEAAEVVARTGYAAELGLGLRTSIDYSDYSLEHIKKNHGERPWTGYIDESARKMSP